MKFHHDIHTHTEISSCCSDRLATPENFIRAAAELGHTVFGFSNHLWDESVDGESGFYHKQSFAHILPEKERIFAADNCGMKILFGAEVEYCGKSDTLALRAENAAVLDYVLIPHTHTHMEGFVIPMADKLAEFRATFPNQLRKAFPWMAEKKAQAIANSFKLPDAMDALDYSWEEYDEVVAEFMMKSFEQLLENSELERLTRTIPVIIAHPFYPCGTIGRIEQEYNLIDKERMRQTFLKAAKMGIAFDVNVNTYRFMDDLEREPLVKVMRLAKECGVKFAFGTDAHRVDVLSTINKGDAIAEAVGITDEDIFELVK